MRRFTVEYFKTLTEAIARVEEKTSAEIVVVVQPRSGYYRDVDFGVGAAAALLGLAGIVYGPWTHAEAAVLIDAALLFGVGAWVSSAVPGIRRALTRPARREAQVRDLAAARFYQENVWTTRGRTGVLIYLSLLEQQLLVLTDRGVTAAVDVTTWNAWLARTRGIPRCPDPPAALLAALEELGKILAAVLPALDDNPDELPNVPQGYR